MTKWILFLLSTTMLSAATPDPKTEKEVLAALDAYKQALIKKDAAALSKVLSDDLTYTHSSNQHQDKAAVIESLKGPASAEAIDFKDPKVRLYGNTAIVKCDVDFRNNTGGNVSVCQAECPARAGERPAGLAAGRAPGDPLSRSRRRQEVGPQRFEVALVVVEMRRDAQPSVPGGHQDAALFQRLRQRSCVPPRQVRRHDLRLVLLTSAPKPRSIARALPASSSTRASIAAGPISSIMSITAPMP